MYIGKGCNEEDPSEHICASLQRWWGGTRSHGLCPNLTRQLLRLFSHWTHQYLYRKFHQLLWQDLPFIQEISPAAAAASPLLGIVL